MGNVLLQMMGAMGHICMLMAILLNTPFDFQLGMILASLQMLYDKIYAWQLK